MDASVPVLSAPISRLALFVSSSSSGSPVWTASPTFLYQCTTVASTMDSPMLGTSILISIIIFLQGPLGKQAKACSFSFVTLRYLRGEFLAFCRGAAGFFASTASSTCRTSSFWFNVYSVNDPSDELELTDRPINCTFIFEPANSSSFGARYAHAPMFCGSSCAQVISFAFG